MSAVRVKIGSAGIECFPISLGGNVFGWTADQRTSFRVLDAYAEAGGNFLDTADGYSRWVPGHVGGESETVIGQWMESRRNRDRIIVSTKVFGHPQYRGLGGGNIRAACDASLARLRTDYIDVYYAHHDDPNAPIEETLAAFTDLVESGKVRMLGVSNFSPERLDEAQRLSREHGFARYEVSQDHYNLMERRYESTLRPVVEKYGMTELPYYALASGFLTGKYRKGAEADSARGGSAGRYLSGHCSDYLDARGSRVLDVLDELAATRRCAVASIALRWLIDQPTIGAAIASARTVEQLPDLLAASEISLTTDEIEALSAASVRKEGEVSLLEQEPPVHAGRN